MRAAIVGKPLPADGSRASELLQLIDLLPHLFRESFHFIRRKLRGAESIADLLIGKPGQISADPLGMLAGFFMDREARTVFPRASLNSSRKIPTA